MVKGVGEMLKKVLSLIISSTLAFSILLINPINSKALSGSEPTYTYWVQDSSTLENTTYSEWENIGDGFVGPGTLSKTYLTTTGSKYIPTGKTGYFQIRNVYNHYKVKMVEWISIDGRKSKVGNVKYVTIKKKEDIQSQIITK